MFLVRELLELKQDLVPGGEERPIDTFGGGLVVDEKIPIKEGGGRFSTSRNKGIIGLINHRDEVTELRAEKLEAEGELFVGVGLNDCLGKLHGL